MSSRQERMIVPAQQPHMGRPYLDRADIVIIGNGIAGLTAAVEARRLAPDKRIVIITNQVHPTINTPALKQYAIGKLEREQLLAYPPGTERAERIHIVTANVETIHARSKYVTLNGKRGFGYDSLLIATGSSPQGVPDNVPGRHFDGILTLHRLQDYLDLRRRIGEVSEAVVIGGGVHAIETVMGLNYWGIHVNWLIRGQTFMGNILDDVASEIVLDRVRRAGISVYTGTEIVGIVGRVGSVAGVITNQQQMIPCQLVVGCTGTRPVLELAEQCSVPLRHGKGIIVDDQLRTSVPHIYAAGDVAALKNPQTGKYEPRAQWYAAVSQGRIAGAMLTGRQELTQEPFGVQWHATHLGELSMLTVGEPLSQDRNIMTLTDRSQGGYRRMTIEGDRLVGYLALGKTPPDSLAIKRIIDEGHSIRAITKELLKGKFDARQYLSELRSRAAQGIITSGRLPVIIDEKQESRQKTNRQLTPMEVVDAALSLPGADARQAETGALQPVARSRGQQEQAMPIASYEEEISPFNGSLPDIATVNASRQDSAEQELVEEISAFSGNLPDIAAHEADSFVGSEAEPAEANFLYEEVSAFTGNLPAISSSREPTSTERKQAIDSTFSPMPEDDWQPPPRSSSLWDYSNAAGVNRGQEKMQRATGAARTASSSRSLWSYSQSPPSTRDGKGR